MRRAATALALALLGAAALAACSKATIQPGNAQLSFERARVQVASAGAPYRSAASGVRLRSGDAVRVVTGEAELRLAHGAVLLLRQASTVVIGRIPEVKAGAVVADVEDTPLTLQALDSEIRVSAGATRVASGLGVTASVYRGKAEVTSADRHLVVPAYRQVSIAAYGVVPSSPSPLAYRADDRWDLHYLGTAIELGEELQRRSDGFTAQLRPGQGLTPGFYSALFPDLTESALPSCPTALDGGLGEGRRAGEVLVGTSLALQADGSFARACREAFAFRDAGAAWGLVALDLGVTSVPAVREHIVAAIGRLPAESTLTAIGPPPAATPTVPVGPDTIVSPVPRVNEPVPPTPAPETPVVPVPSPTPTSPPLPNPLSPEPDDGLLTPVTDLVDNLLSGLLG